MSIALSSQFTRGLKAKRVPADTLKPTQQYVNPVKVAQMAKQPVGKPIVIDRSGNVQDGHHRWVAGSKRGRKTIEAYTLG
jgi:hypothetical protein